MKHQQQTPATTDFFNKGAMHEPMSALHANFSDLTLKEPQVVSEHFKNNIADQKISLRNMSRMKDLMIF